MDASCVKLRLPCELQQEWYGSRKKKQTRKRKRKRKKEEEKKEEEEEEVLVVKGEQTPFQSFKVNSVVHGQQPHTVPGT